MLCIKLTRKRWRALRQTINPNQGGAVTRLKVPQTGGDHLYATRGGVETQAAQHIAMRYRTAQGAPIIQDAHLHHNFGYLADT
jgi:hypothetical protein